MNTYERTVENREKEGKSLEIENTGSRRPMPP
jgi:hypothetical protein